MSAEDEREGYWADGTPMNHPRPPQHERVERINLVWKYRREHKTFPWISETMGISVSTAHKYFKEGYRMKAPPGAEEDRVLAIEHLDEMLADAKEAYNELVEPLEKLKALEVMNKLLKSKRDLLGLDAPTKFQGVVHNVDAQELELAQMIERMKAQDAERAAELRAGAAPRTRRRRKA